MIANTYYWTPAGTPFFSKSTCTTIIDINKINRGEYLNGVLYSWQENGVTYVADIDKTKGLFYGYVKSGTTEKYKDITTLTKEKTIPVNSIMYIGNCTKEDVITQYKVAENIDGALYYTNGKPLITNFTYTQGIRANALTINNCTDVSFTGKAKDFKDYCNGKFDASQISNVDKAAAKIQLMADRYGDYEKITLSTNPYNTWVNTPEHLSAFNTALLNYYEAHKNAPKIENSNCPDCPKYPVVGDAYWDIAGRNWVFWEGNKWKDLTGEFCEEEGCNNDWKNGIDVQVVHKAFYEDKVIQYENDALQTSLGGINEEFKQQLWRSTQFITVHALKDNWKEEQVGDSWWVPVWGSVKSSVANIQVANGDMTYYTKATLDGIFAATDVFLVKALATGIYKVGIKKLIIEGGAKQITKQLYYTACKKAVTLRLAYTLRLGTPEATAFFNKQLTKTIEIYDISASRYIKFDPATGEALSGKFVAGEGQSITYESYGKISVRSGLSEAEQANVVTAEIAKLVQNDLKTLWNNLSELPAKTSSKTYTLYRRVNIDWEPAVTHPAQILNDGNRYSKGREAVYFGTSQTVTDAEWLAYNPKNGLKGEYGSKLYKFEVDEADLLDLTKSESLDKLGINQAVITEIENKVIPQELGDWAFSKGYKGIIFPSARKTGESNIVLFKYFTGNTPPSIKSTTLLETLK